MLYSVEVLWICILNLILIGLFTCYTIDAEFGNSMFMSDPIIYALVLAIPGIMTLICFMLIRYKTKRYARNTANAITDIELITVVSLLSCIVLALICFILGNENEMLRHTGRVVVALIVGRFVWFDASLTKLFGEIKTIVRTILFIPWPLTYFLVSSLVVIYGSRELEIVLGLSFLVISIGLFAMIYLLGVHKKVQLRKVNACKFKIEGNKNNGPLRC